MTEQTFEPTPIEWQINERQSNYETPLRFANLTQDGFSVNVSIYYDWDHDWCRFRGHFTDRWEEGAIKNPWYHDARQGDKFFVPITSEAKLIEEYYQGGHNKKEATKLVRERLIEDCKIADDPTRAGYSALSIIAKVFLKGVQLGSAGVGGTEVEDIEDPYILELSWEVIEDALREARSNLAALKSA